MADLARTAGVTPGVIRAMAQVGLLVPAPITEHPFPRPIPDHPGPHLAAEQASAAQRLREAVSAERYSVTLLDGVTGSGKTEVYLEAVAECLRRVDRR